MNRGIALLSIALSSASATLAWSETGTLPSYWPKRDADRFAMEVLREFHTAQMMNEYCGWISAVEFNAQTKYLWIWAEPVIKKHPKSYKDVIAGARNVVEMPMSFAGFNRATYCEERRELLPALISRASEFEESVLDQGED